MSNILAQKEIRNQEELNEVTGMLHFYRQASVDKDTMDGLEHLLTDLFKQRDDPAFAETFLKKKAGHTEIVKREEKDGMVVESVHIFTGPKPAHFEEQHIVSPDSKRKICVTQWRSGKHASTSVSVIFETASGTLYWTNGIRPDIKAFWKDNGTIIIETRKDYEAGIRYKEIRSFDDVVAIEYIEHE